MHSVDAEQLLVIKETLESHTTLNQRKKKDGRKTRKAETPLLTALPPSPILSFASSLQTKLMHLCVAN